MDKFIKDVGKLLKEARSVVIAVSEGVKVADGRYVCELSDHVDYVDAFGHKQLAGTARFLAGKIAENYGVKQGQSSFPPCNAVRRTFRQE